MLAFGFVCVTREFLRRTRVDDDLVKEVVVIKVKMVPCVRGDDYVGIDVSVGFIDSRTSLPTGIHIIPIPVSVHEDDVGYVQVLDTVTKRMFRVGSRLENGGQ